MYRVVWCNCRSNPALKTSNEWCEWCRCPKCGSSKKYAPNVTEEVKLNIDLVLVVLCLFVIGYVLWQGEHKLYLIPYGIGAIALFFYIRSFFSNGTILLNEPSNRGYNYSGYTQ